MADLSKVAVITVNYGSHHLLQRNLAALTEQAPSLTAIVCDNWTTDEERARVADLCHQYGWTFVPAQTNGGFASGCNQAAAAALGAGATCLLLLNPDARVDAETVNLLAAAVQADPDCLAVPAMFDAAGRERAAARVLRLDNGTMAIPANNATLAPTPDHLPWLTGACLMVSTAMWRGLGGLAEDYFMYWEDVEFCVRAEGVGARLRILPEGRCFHDQGGTQRAAHESDHESRKGTTFFYFAARNRLLFAARNLDPQTQQRWLRTSTPAAWYLLKRARGRRRALLQSPDAIAAALRGIRDGRRLLREHAAGTDQQPQ